MRCPPSAPIALAALALLGASARPANATILPAIDRTDREAVVTVGTSVITHGMTAEMGVVNGVSLGVAHYRIVPLFSSGSPEFSALRITHRVWAFPRGAALGYVLSLGHHRNFNRGGDYQSTSFQPAFATAVPLALPDGTPVVLRATYGPVIGLYQQYPEFPESLSPDLEPRPATYDWRPSSANQDWSLNVEAAVVLGERLELVIGGGNAVGVRALW